MAPSAYAADPSTVFQAVSDALSTTALLRAANLSAQPAAAASAIDGRRPRHVLQKAREVFEKLQMLCWVNGLARNDFKIPLDAEPSPDDVLRAVGLISDDLASLIPVFGVDAAIAPSPLIPGKTPSDVYAHLSRLSASIDALGIPTTVPNDVYQIALTIERDLAPIFDAFGAPFKDLNGPPSTGKTPADVYAKAFGLYAALAQLTRSRPDVAPVGGFAPPPRVDRAITPAVVLDVLNSLLADITSMNLRLGAQLNVALAARPSGRTPSDVFNALDGLVAHTRSLDAQ